MSEDRQVYYHNLRENAKRMSPKLKELAIRAGAYQDNDGLLTGPMDVHKFADYILSECLLQVEHCKAVSHASYIDTYNRALDSATQQIKKHFDIE